MTFEHAVRAGATYLGGDGDRRPRLLIADDEVVVRAALSAQLAGDFEVIAVAENATEASELAATHRPDVALIDVEMPGGGARRAAPRSPRALRTPAW
jgi:CheY-like chemotaxis protein